MKTNLSFEETMRRLTRVSKEEIKAKESKITGKTNYSPNIKGSTRKNKTK